MLTAIILTYNEELHIERCIHSLKPVADRIIIVDSYSKDNTCEIAAALGAEVFQNPFVTQAVQFQWAMDNCNVDSEWVIRLDADETIDQELANNIKTFISDSTNTYNGAIFHRKHIFLGKWVKHGGRYPLPMLRLFRNGFAHVEQRWMDEHIVLDSGESKVLEGGFEDNNLNSVSWFIDKHNKYAAREVIDIMLKKLNVGEESQITSSTGFAIKMKRFLKQNVYMKLPYFVRPFVYFNFRYIAQFGFLDGARGFAYHFMQGFWYRALVDLKCLEIEQKWKGCSSQIEKIQALEDVTGFKVSDS